MEIGERERKGAVRKMTCTRRRDFFIHCKRVQVLVVVVAAVVVALDLKKEQPSQRL